MQRGVGRPWRGCVRGAQLDPAERADDPRDAPAAARSTDARRACGYSLRTNATCSCRQSRSSTKPPWPRSSRGSSNRRTAAPIPAVGIHASVCSRAQAGRWRDLVTAADAQVVELADQRKPRQGVRMTHFDGKVALVTGARFRDRPRVRPGLCTRRGAGRCIGRAAVGWRRDGASDPRGRRWTAHFLQADVSDEASVEHLIAASIAEYGHVDFAHNNAGVAAPPAPLHEADRAWFDRVQAVNVTGVWLCLEIRGARDAVSGWRGHRQHGLGSRD